MKGVAKAEAVFLERSPDALGTDERSADNTISLETDGLEEAKKFSARTKRKA